MTTYAGCDADQFPGLDVTGWLRAHTNLKWLGYYLTAPSHHDGGWLGKRRALADQGWGLGVVYVGQQIVGPGSKVMTADQGEADGADAAAKMATEGFALGSTVYLDCEEGPAIGGGLDPRRALYLDAWAQAVADGGYAPGVYGSHLYMRHVADLLPADSRLWAVHVPTMSPFLTSDAALPAPAMAGCGYPEAACWQHRMSVTMAQHGIPRRVFVDLDVSTLPDPSAPAAADGAPDA